MKRAFLAAALLGAGAALGQTPPPPGFQAGQNILFWEGTLRGSPRLMGLAGAYVAIADGAEGITRNPAAAASRDPRFESDFNIDLGGTMHFLFPGAVAEQDWDNDGFRDQTPGTASFLGSQVFYSAATFQYKQFALGIGVDSQNFLSRYPEDLAQGFADERVYNLNLLHVFASLAGTFWRDQIQVGLGVETTHAFMFYSSQSKGSIIPSLEQSLGYHGWGLTVGGLWRPVNQNYRVGMAFKPAVTARSLPLPAAIGGIIPFQAVSTPARLSLGGTLALGEGGRALNIGGPSGWVDTGEKFEDGYPIYSVAMTKWLFTTQFDVFFPVTGATTIGAFLRQPDFAAYPAGAKVALQIRAGVEKEVISDRLRLRLGSYLEPPMTDTGPVLRPHICFGGEVYLFPIGSAKLAAGVAVDFASQYTNMSIAIFLWK